MNFQKVFKEVTSRLDEADVRYALIGGFAMALRGVQRATVDLDKGTKPVRFTGAHWKL